MLADLDLLKLLAHCGQVTLVGSAATGLLVQPDVDMCLLSETWGAGAALLAARSLASHPRVQKLHCSCALKPTGCPTHRQMAIVGGRTRVLVCGGM